MSETLIAHGESLVDYLTRTEGAVSQRSMQQWVGAAGPFKEGDQTIRVAARDDEHRRVAQQLLSNTVLSHFVAHPLHDDGVFQYITTTTDPQIYETVKSWTVERLKLFLLTSAADEIHAVLPGLPSDAIASVVKLMSNDDLVSIGQKVFNPLPNSRVGSAGYMGARVQPNSPTDHPDDVMWQVFNAWSFAVGDVMLGTNPVGSTEPAVAGVELILKDLVTTFALHDHLPWVVLAHIDVQDAVERLHPGSTTLYFQSLAGTETANDVFDAPLSKMIRYTDERHGRYHLYIETGQGADFTNGQAHGVDMSTLEARKYGVVRGLKKRLGPEAWVVVNDVAGFIGPEVFKTREQLVRVALEDTVMGKLHGLTIGLDICSTLHMPVGLSDLDYAIDHIMPANPAYLMALPTKNDPMLSYLTTAFQDHVRIRNRFGYKVNDPMWAFFQHLGVIRPDGTPTEHFGDPVHVYVRYAQAKGDPRPEKDLYAAGQALAQHIVDRGVPLAIGTGQQPWDMHPELAHSTAQLVDAARACIWDTLTPEFVQSLSNPIPLTTMAPDREQYILRPPQGEVLTDTSHAHITDLAEKRRAADLDYDVQIVVSDGLNARSITDDGHLAPFLAALCDRLEASGRRVAPECLVVANGRVRVGYRIGEVLFKHGHTRKTIVHIIGERPGTPHNNYSVYLATADPAAWARPNHMDHDRVKVISGISDTALTPTHAAERTCALIQQLESTGRVQ